MTRHLLVFLGTFALGAIVALAARTARHEPHRDHAAHSSSPAAAPLASDTMTPTAAAADPHAGHKAAPAGKAAASDRPVNTRCAICGMDVDPKLPTLEYQGKKIGFGCRMCPPKFKADPDKYGPYYLRNEVIKN